MPLVGQVAHALAAVVVAHDSGERDNGSSRGVLDQPGVLLDRQHVLGDHRARHPYRRRLDRPGMVAPGELVHRVVQDALQNAKAVLHAAAGARQVHDEGPTGHARHTA